MSTATLRTRILPRRFRRALIIEHPDPSLDAHLARLGIEADRITETPTEAKLVELLAEGQHDLIYKRSRVLITEAVLTASRNLAAVMLCCIGDDSIDKPAAARHGVIVTHDPVSNGRSVAEMVIGETIVMARRIVESANEMATSNWRKNNQRRFEVRGKTMGILGLGKIGRQVAQLAEALGMNVLFFDTDDVATEVGQTLGWSNTATIEELFEQSHVLTVHVSANDVHGRSNSGFLSREQLMLLGASAGPGPRLFLNLARGFLYDPADLIAAVEADVIQRVFTDVYPDEPRSKDDHEWRNPFEGHPAILCTPHIGAATLEAQPRIASYVARTTQLLATQGALRNCVFLPKASISLSPEHKHHLVVVHTDTRGTKKAVDDAIYGAGVNNIESAHIDFPGYGVAYDASALDRALTPAEIEGLIANAAELTGDPNAIRTIRMISREDQP